MYTRARAKREQVPHAHFRKKRAAAICPFSQEESSRHMPIFARREQPPYAHFRKKRAAAICPFSQEESSRHMPIFGFQLV